MSDIKMSDIGITVQHSAAGIVTRRIGYAAYGFVAERTHFTLRESIWNSVRFPVWVAVGGSLSVSIEDAVRIILKQQNE
jgi:hypothetical protein